MDYQFTTPQVILWPFFFFFIPYKISFLNMSTPISEVDLQVISSVLNKYLGKISKQGTVILIPQVKRTCPNNFLCFWENLFRQNSSTPMRKAATSAFYQADLVKSAPQTKQTEGSSSPKKTRKNTNPNADEEQRRIEQTNMHLDIGRE